jgi:gas vesicle protein
MRKFGSFILGAVFGGLLGSAVILLLAPGNGNETQNAIRERFTNLRIELGNAIAEKRSALEAELQAYKNQK